MLSGHHVIMCGLVWFWVDLGLGLGGIRKGGANEVTMHENEEVTPSGGAVSCRSRQADGSAGTHTRSIRHGLR